jgi:hypothetical protein
MLEYAHAPVERPEAQLAIREERRQILDFNARVRHERKRRLFRLLQF